MKGRRVRRLPVVDRQERLVGIVSMNDLVADRESGANVPGDEFHAPLESICGHLVTAVPA